MLKNENVYSKIFLKLMKNQYFQFFLRHWFLNLWRLINIWIWYLELAFIPLWLIRKKESDQIKIRKIILKLWVFELIWGKMFCSSFEFQFFCLVSSFQNTYVGSIHENISIWFGLKLILSHIQSSNYGSISEWVSI